MKKITYLLMLISFVSVTVFGQVNQKMKDNAPFQKTLKFNNSQSKESAIVEFGKKYNLDGNNTFEAKKETSDDSGLSHQRNQQYYKGIKVEFGTLITHTRDGQVESVNGELYDAKALNLKPTLTSNTAFKIALDFIGAQTYLWEDEMSSKAMSYSKPKGDIVIFPKVNTGEIKLAYKFDVYATAPLSRDEIYIDAHTGEILYRNPIIHHATKAITNDEMEARAKAIEYITIGSKTAPFLTGSATTRYSGVRSIETTLSTTYSLSEATRGTGNGMVTYNSGKTPTYPSTNFTNTTNTWNTGNYAAASATKDNAALDAHWGAEKTYDFWKNIFGRNSYDDAGAKILSYVHYDDKTTPPNIGYDNAFWNGSVMTYGDGNTFNVLTALDVCGHEIGHAVCQYTAALAYQNQSGGMNEGFSDIWGTCIEQYGRNGNLTAPVDGASPGTQGVWKIGEDLATSPLRSMSYPNTRGNPDTFQGTYWTVTADDGACSPTGGPTGNDFCGVHNNSGVLNHWFYIVTSGKSATNNAPTPFAYNVTGIGMAKSAQITYYAERDYLTPNATYLDMRNATIAVASTLYCATSPEVQAVTKAWKAVNVGADYAGLTNDVALKSISGGNTSVACGATFSPTIVMENGGIASISAVTITYNIDGGANSTINWTGSLANCSTANQAISVTGLTRGFHTLNVTTTTTGDGNATNNTKSTTIVVNDAGVVGTVNNFNATTDALVAIDFNGKTSTIWERGTLTTKTKLTNAIAGSQVYATKLTAAIYPDATTSYLVSQCYNLSNIASASVNFDMAFDLEENYDVVYFEYSTNGGTTWNILGTSADANWYNSSRTNASSGATNDCQICPGAQWTGTYAVGPTLALGGTGVNGNKRNYSHSLTPFGFGGATPASNIIFRFNFGSDSSAALEGAFIDNFVVTGTLGNAETKFEDFSVSPNPSRGTVLLSLSATSDVKVSLYDLSGRSIYNKTFNNNSISFNQELKFDNLSKGVYLLNVESDGKKASKKLIIE